MIKGKFTWAGKSSDDFSMKMLDQPSFASPAKDETANTVSGRNGTVWTPNNRLADISDSFTFHADITDDFFSTIRRIKNWLLAPDGYQYMTWDWATDLTYLVHMDGSTLNFQKLSNRKVQVVIGVTIYPIAFYTDSLSEKQVTGSIVNNGLFVAKPILRFVGTGGGTFQLGDSHIVLQNVTNQITIDVEAGTAIDADGQAAYSQINTATYPALPTLKVGTNALTIPSGWALYITGRFGEFA